VIQEKYVPGSESFSSLAQDDFGGTAAALGGWFIAGPTGL